MGLRLMVALPDVQERGQSFLLSPTAEIVINSGNKAANGNRVVPNS